VTKIPGDGVLLQKPDLLQNCPTLHSALEPQRHGAEAARFSKGPHGSKVLFVSEKIPDELSGAVGRFSGDRAGEGDGKPRDGDETHSVLAFRLYPSLHDAHLAALLVHADPVAGNPLLHVHVNAAHATPLKYLLAPHDVHLAAPCVGQSSPPAPVPP
jgi:hypothetical protein